MTATVRQVAAGAGLRKFQAAWFLLERVYVTTWCHTPWTL